MKSTVTEDRHLDLFGCLVYKKIVITEYSVADEFELHRFVTYSK